MINDVIYKIQEFIDQDPGIYFFLFSKSSESAIDAVSAGPPFVFIDQCPGVLNKVQILRAQLIDFCANSLEQGGKSNGFFNGHRDITNAEFNSIEKRMNPQVPPYFFSIINAIRFHQEFHIILIRLNAVKCFWNTRAGKFIEYFCTK